MENNGYNNAQQNGAAAPTDNVVTFPGSDETDLQDISTLLGDAPVLQKEPAANASQLTKGAIASKADFEAVEEARPFAHKIGPKTLAGAALAGLTILPLSLFLVGGGSKSNNEQTVAEVVPAGEEEDSSYVSPDDVAAMQAELEQLRSQQAFIDQQVDAEAIDAMGKQKTATAKSQTKPPSTATTAAKPAPAAKPSTVTTVSSRPAPPTPSRVIAPAPPRSTPAATPPRSSAPIAQAPTRPMAAQPPEPVDPFERRAQLQALGTYGAPPPTAQAATRSASNEASNPFESPYIQAIAVETPQAQPAIARAPAEEVAPTQRAPLTEEEMLYEQDAATVLAAAPTEAPEAEIESYQTERPRPVIERDDAAVLDPRRFKTREENEPVLEASKPQPSAASPIAIMPGTSTEAELPYGFSWQEGTPLPEVLMTTTEDIMAGSLAVIPAGTQFLGQAQIDPGSGVVTIQVVGLFGETRDVQIPRSSVVVQAADGSVLTASASGGDRTASGSGVGGFLMESLANSVGNVIDSDDSLVGDLAGGVAETVIDGQVQRSQTNAATRSSRAAAQPIVWTLSARPVQLTFNNYIPLYSEQH